jgi:thioredoxin-like negative regulator of GroEL
MEVDDYPNLCEKYSIEVYPTVIYFQNGKVVKRLDGTRGFGLHEQQFRGLIDLCRKQEK